MSAGRALSGDRQNFDGKSRPDAPTKIWNYARASGEESAKAEEERMKAEG